MDYIAKEDIQKAKEMDLMTYLQNYEPGEIVHVSGNIYCTKEHDSLRISNGKWYWFSHGIGGRSALDYLVKVKDIPFTQAVKTILGQAAAMPPVIYRQHEVNRPDFQMPELSETTLIVEKYLHSRGISYTVIRYCIEQKTLFESSKYHNAIFVGYDENGVAKYGAVRGTIGQFKGELPGSNKQYSFSLGKNKAAAELHVFESAIDAMSYASLCEIKGTDWKDFNLLSLAGVYQTKRENACPIALVQFLKEHPSVKTIHLHLDNDEAGRGASVAISTALQQKYTICDEPPAYGKDVNDELKNIIQTKRKDRER